jgi:hypothetical protein
VAAVVLGGSHARGDARPDSDLDFGLYYRDKFLPEIDAVRSVAEAVSIPTRPPTVTRCYEWGPWVNGGAWLHTPAGKVDFLYRNIDQVQRVIGEAREGVYHHDFFQQPTFGFTSVIYLAETRSCIPLVDPEALVTSLKSAAEPYPIRLQQKLVRDSLWIAEFTLVHARGFAARNDIFNSAGCLARIGYFLVHAIFALNAQYYFGDKGAIEALARFEIQPSDFNLRLDNIFRRSTTQSSELAHAVDLIQELWSEIVILAEGSYAPKFDKV